MLSTVPLSMSPLSRSNFVILGGGVAQRADMATLPDRFFRRLGQCQIVLLCGLLTVASLSIGLERRHSMGSFEIGA